MIKNYTTDHGVWNLHSIHPSNGTLVDRRTKWGNPFEIGKDGNRRQVIEKFRQSITPEFEQEIKTELCGKDLLCHCKPKACHGDVLFEIANTKTLF